MEEILYGRRFGKEIIGYWKVEFFDDEGRNLTHWLSYNQIRYFKNREDIAKYIKEVKSWNIFNFSQTLITKIKD